MEMMLTRECCSAEATASPEEVVPAEWRMGWSSVPWTTGVVLCGSIRLISTVPASSAQDLKKQL